MELTKWVSALVAMIAMGAQAAFYTLPADPFQPGPPADGRGWVTMRGIGMGQNTGWPVGTVSNQWTMQNPSSWGIANAGIWPIATSHWTDQLAIDSGTIIDVYYLTPHSVLDLGSGGGNLFEVTLHGWHGTNLTYFEIHERVPLIDSTSEASYTVSYSYWHGTNPAWLNIILNGDTAFSPAYLTNTLPPSLIPPKFPGPDGFQPPNFQQPRASTSYPISFFGLMNNSLYHLQTNLDMEGTWVDAMTFTATNCGPRGSNYCTFTTSSQLPANQFFRLTGTNWWCESGTGTITNYSTVNPLAWVAKTFPANKGVLVCNPFWGAANDLNSIIPHPPSNTVVNFFDTGLQDLNSNNVPVYLGTNWFPNPIIQPGQGFFVIAPTDFTNFFTGQIPQGILTNPVPIVGGGTYVCVGNMVPQGGYLTNVLKGYAPSDNDEINTWDVTAQDMSTNISTYVASTGRWTPDQYIGAGQGFFIIRSATNTVTWTRTNNLAWH